MKSIVIFTLCCIPLTLAGYCSRPDTDCPGHDIRTLDADAVACKKACNADKNCLSIQFNLGKCTLKDYACEGSELKGLVGGNDYVKVKQKCRETKYAVTKKSYCRRKKTHCKGYNIQVLKGLSTKRCQALCSTIPGCKSISSDGENCNLQSKACTNEEISLVRDRTDYVKVDRKDECAKYRVKLPVYCCRGSYTFCEGHTFFQIKKSGYSECKYFCALKPQCKAWHWKSYWDTCSLIDHMCTSNELTRYTDWLDGARGLEWVKFEGLSDFDECRGNLKQ